MNVRVLALDYHRQVGDDKFSVAAELECRDLPGWGSTGPSPQLLDKPWAGFDFSCAMIALIQRKILPHNPARLRKSSIIRNRTQNTPRPRRRRITPNRRQNTKQRDRSQKFTSHFNYQFPDFGSQATGYGLPATAVTILHPAAGRSSLVIRV